MKNFLSRRTKTVTSSHLEIAISEAELRKALDAPDGYHIVTMDCTVLGMHERKLKFYLFPDK
jgi:hypothetical protein